MPHTPERSCGTCTACCKTHQVFELEKLAGKWCSHCIIGKGCTIYADRPEGCRAFSCQWLLGLGGEDERPDRTKMVVDYCYMGTEEELVCLVWEVSDGAFIRPKAQGIIDTILKSIPVIKVFLSGEKESIIPGELSLVEKVRIYRLLHETEIRTFK